MPKLARIAVVAAAVIATLGLTVPSAAPAATSPSRAAKFPRYLNLHQCVYTSNGSYFTNVEPNLANSAFNSGTNTSGTADTSVRCGAGAAGWSLVSGNSSVKAFDLSAGRYLNLHQCLYTSNGSYYSNVQPNTPNTPFNTGSNVSGTADTTLRCGAGNSGWSLVTGNSSVRAYDLMAGPYLNLHQCVYYSSSGNSYVTNVQPNLADSAFNSGTNVSGTADTSVRCGAGASGWSLSTANSSVAALS
ncbi:hypothetical protein [Streptomyces sp. ISL-11]|uniref:hypothetical protein n=1 Tax=Streptomyces sp. ISL-11 TaxID=2819174 RepID=UPI001BE85E2D|nr:hypothetical protein [Streptomyces sp. ISL-11]MBT2384372.1 hypothetical protein [Streptomyces sp. ISL-11]